MREKTQQLLTAQIAADLFGRLNLLVQSSVQYLLEMEPSDVTFQPVIKKLEKNRTTNNNINYVFNMEGKNTNLSQTC